ncbi:MAG: hypothetical protein J5795_00075 [Lachnospiraceae bacterium]|nr:hypothetical protein [Lachnospiraceae bacterium]MBO7631590.1 hypothetical protein [Lachnospiraceae bacterium]
MLTSKFTRVLAILIVVLELASIVMTFVGAFMGGERGQGFLFTGMFGFVAVAVLGWIMITVYNRVHREEETVTQMILDAENSAEEEKAAEE